MAKDQKRKVRLCDLVEDMTVYPRAVVDDVHIQDLLYAHQAGAALPPIVVDAATLRITDGVHRSRMYKKALGEEGEIEVIARTYSDDAELLLDAARMNSHAVRKLARSDQVRVIILARDLGADDERIASSLAVPVERIVRLAVRIAVGPSGEGVATKQGSDHLGGHTLTPEQVQGIRQMRGVQTARLVWELIALLERDVANLEDPKLCRALLRLVEVVQKKLPASDAAQAA